MQQVVYVDVLLALNVIISFLLLRAVCRLGGESPSTLRVLLGSALGGAYSLCIFLPPLHTAFTVAARIVFLMLVCLLVFGFGTPRRFFRCFGLLCAVTLLLAGLIMGFWFIFRPQGLLIRNGSVYFDVSFLTLVLACAAFYAAVWLFSRFFRKQNRENAEAAVLIAYKDKTVKARGVIDTGNTLTDSFTGQKVSVIDQSTALALLPADMAAAAINPSGSCLPQGMHLIVSNTVGGTVLMTAFTADRIEITANENTAVIHKAAVAVSSQTKFGSGCSVLLNADIMNL